MRGEQHARKFPDSLAGAEVSDIDLAEEEFIVDGERLTDERADEITADVLAKARARNAQLGEGRSG